jgi:hypothetical protein
MTGTFESNVLLVGVILGEFSSLSLPSSKLSYETIGFVSIEVLILDAVLGMFIYIGYYELIYEIKFVALELLNLFDKLFPYL